jgi:hypothetical protein
VVVTWVDGHSHGVLQAHHTSQHRRIRLLLLLLCQLLLRLLLGLLVLLWLLKLLLCVLPWVLLLLLLGVAGSVQMACSNASLGLIMPRLVLLLLLLLLLLLKLLRLHDILSGLSRDRSIGWRCFRFGCVTHTQALRCRCCCVTSDTTQAVTTCCCCCCCCWGWLTPAVTFSTCC